MLRIESLFKVLPIEVTVEKKRRIKRIRVQGRSEDVASAVPLIYKIFMEVKTDEFERATAQLITKTGYYNSFLVDILPYSARLYSSNPFTLCYIDKQS